MTLSADQAIVPQPTCGTDSVPRLVKSVGSTAADAAVPFAEQYEDDVDVVVEVDGANASTTRSVEAATMMAMVAPRLLFLFDEHSYFSYSSLVIIKRFYERSTKTRTMHSTIATPQRNDSAGACIVIYESETISDTFTPFFTYLWPTNHNKYTKCLSGLPWDEMLIVLLSKNICLCTIVIYVAM